MNGISSLGGTQAPNTSSAEGSSFEAMFPDALAARASVMMQFLGSDLIQSTMQQNPWDPE